MVSASVMVDALKGAGKNLSRKSLMKSVLHLNIKKNPFVLPGIKIKTSPTRPLADRTGANGALAGRPLAPFREARHRSAEVRLPGAW